MSVVLKTLMLGIADGNFRALPERKGEFLETFRRAKKRYFPHVETVFAPRVNFTNNLAIPQGTHGHEEWEDGFFRTETFADGGLIQGSRKAIAILNGDCQCFALTQDDRLALLHVGYRCMIQETPKTPGIIEVAMRRFDPLRVRVTIWGGTGCWDPESDKPEIWNPDLAPNDRELLVPCLTTTHATSPWGVGRPTVDLYKLAKLQLLRAGVPAEHLEIDATCSTCTQENGKPKYWSYTRFKKEETDWKKHGGASISPPVNGRNLSIAWLEAT